MNIDSSSQKTFRTKAIQNFRVSREILNLLDPIEKLAAMAAIREGRWILVEEADHE